MYDPEGGLTAHNEAREQKGCQPLQWNERLAQDAQAYAQKLADKNKMQHDDIDEQGENLHWCSAESTYKRAVVSWMNEERFYHGEAVGQGDDSKWGHFCE